MAARRYRATRRTITRGVLHVLGFLQNSEISLPASPLVTKIQGDGYQYIPCMIAKFCGLVRICCAPRMGTLHIPSLTHGRLMYVLDPSRKEYCMHKESIWTYYWDMYHVLDQAD